jgi:tetratricopeptide (TPR) repeat protein
MQGWFLALTLVCAVQPEQNLIADFEAGCQAFDQGHWEAAEAAFAGLKAKGIDSGWLMYNLGNSHLKAGRLGEAIASYREALCDLPRHSDIRANLAFARRRVQDAVAPVEPLALPRTLFFWHYVLNFREALWVAGLLLAFFWLARMCILLDWQRRTAQLVGAVSGVCALAQIASIGVHGLYPEHLAVIVADEVEVHIANQAQAPVRFVLHAGCETRVHAQLDGWVLVALSDGKQGWVPRQSVAVVAI